jgi:cytochrome c biogenesis protein CcmG/thiol:disulfide interchange protein DsbE
VEPNFTVGQQAPELMLPFLEGGPPVSLRAQIKGPALVNLFGSWCVPCAQEAPFLMDLHKKGVRIIGIDEGQHGEADPPDKLAAFLRNYGDPYAVILVDEKSRAIIDFGATGVPETFVVDSTGKIVGKHLNLTSPDDVAEMMRLLAAAR